MLPGPRSCGSSLPSAMAVEQGEGGFGALEDGIEGGLLELRLQTCPMRPRCGVALPLSSSAATIARVEFVGRCRISQSFDCRFRALGPPRLIKAFAAPIRSASGAAFLPSVALRLAICALTTSAQAHRPCPTSPRAAKLPAASAGCARSFFKAAVSAGRTAPERRSRSSGDALEDDVLQGIRALRRQRRRR